MDLRSEFIPGIPEMFLAGAALILLMVGTFLQKDSLKNVMYLTLSVLLIAMGIVVRFGGTDAIAFNGLFVTNSFTQFCKVIILFVTTVILYMSDKHLEREGVGRFEYPILVLFATLGMLMMVSANDFIALFMGLELHSLALYILVAAHREHRLASEAGLKYFVLGTVATAFIVYGSSLIYGFTGTTEFSSILVVLKAEPQLSGLVLTALLFLLSGLAFKVSLAPFHMWVPDVYEGSPTPVTAFLSSAPKFAAFVLLVRVLIDVFGLYVSVWQVGFLMISLGSMCVGAFGALFQKNIKRLLAYSSISHMGYALLGLLGGTTEGIQSILVYLTLYALMSGGIFAGLLCLRRHGKLLEEIEDLSGLSQDNPLIALSLAILFFSLAGIPPLAGFFAKLDVFMAALQSGFYISATVGVLTTVVAAAYYIKIVRIMYFQAPLGSETSPFKIDSAVSVQTMTVLLGTLIVMVGFVFFPDFLMNPAYTAAKSLVLHPIN